MISPPDIPRSKRNPESKNSAVRIRPRRLFRSGLLAAGIRKYIARLASKIVLFNPSCMGSQAREDQRMDKSNMTSRIT